MPTTSEALTIAIGHHQAGRLQAAEQIYRQILAVEPNYAAPLHLLGVVALQIGKHNDAIEYITRAIALDGKVATFHYNLGNTFTAQRKFDEAVASYRLALELKPDYAEAYINLGNALQSQGKLCDAIACYRSALNLQPDIAELHANLGNTLKSVGILDEAIACYRRALELKPDYAEAIDNLGNALRDQRKFREAIACYGRAIELRPDLAQARNNLGIALRQQGRVNEAIASFQSALAQQPGYIEAHDNLGSALKEVGDLAGAEKQFRAALRHNSRFALAHYKLAGLLGGKLPEQDLAAQRKLLADAESTDAERLLLHFSLAQVLDARSEYAEAAEHLARGNALQLSAWRKAGKQYDPKEYESLVGQIIDLCSAEFFERIRGAGIESEIPVFIVGLPRSGTTLVEQILASHSQVHGAGEIKLVGETLGVLGGQTTTFMDTLRHLNRDVAARLASQHLEKLRDLNSTASRIVDKMPENYLFLGILVSLFPRAKLIHCRRDLRDVAVSCWMTHFEEARWTNDQLHIASRFREHERIMNHWRKVLPAPLFELDYEETVADLEGSARKLVAWCDLDWEPACLQFHQSNRSVRTASAVQVRQPVYRTAVGRWKYYDHALGPLFARIEAMKDDGSL